MISRQTHGFVRTRSLATSSAGLYPGEIGRQDESLNYGRGRFHRLLCLGALLQNGHQVVVLDNLDPQIHGENAEWPSYMPAGTENHVGDVRNRELVRELLGKSDAVIHLAAAVGVGQSMYRIEHYCSVSVLGTAILLEEMIPLRGRIKKLIVASSMSIYGEGAYRDADGNAASCASARSNN